MSSNPVHESPYRPSPPSRRARSWLTDTALTAFSVAIRDPRELVEVGEAARRMGRQLAFDRSDIGLLANVLNAAGVALLRLGARGICHFVDASSWTQVRLRITVEAKDVAPAEIEPVLVRRGGRSRRRFGEEPMSGIFHWQLEPGDASTGTRVTLVLERPRHSPVR